jgi:hypothetical protein
MGEAKSLRHFFYLSIILFLFACSKIKEQPDISVLNISSVSFAGTPCIETSIEEEIVSMELDLGLQGDLSIHKNFIEKIKNKDFIGTKSFVGFNGIPYEKELYRLPYFLLGNLSFYNRILQEHDSKFDQQSTLFVQDPEETIGRIGWKIFADQALLLDVKNQKLLLSKSGSTLASRLKGNFAIYPLTTDNGLLEFFLKTPEGNLKCLIDSGSTWNFLNRQVQSKKNLENGQLSLDEQVIIHSDLGEIAFHKAVTTGLDEEQAVLGMEFLEDRQVLIDFLKKVVLIQVD